MQQEQPEQKRRRGLRVLLLVGVTGLATAAIGFGGLAAWSVTTQNNGSQFSSGTVHHTNKATSNISVVGATNPGSVVATCDDTTSPGSCGLVFNVTAAKPGAVATGSIQITNTGTLQSTFTLGLASAPVSSPGGNTICNDMTLQIKDNEAAPATVYATAALAGLPSTAIKPSTGTAFFNTSDTGTYTFTLTLSAGALNTSMGGTCTAAFVFTQTNT